MTNFKYAAFISYRHLPLDAEVAKQVQHAIETYRVPRGTQSPAGFKGGQALGNCFRDEDELSAAHSLPQHITEALEQSSALVVVCSPETAKSAWVLREIETFIEMHGRDRVFVVLAEGSPSECIPEILRHQTVVDIDGKERVIPSEPLAADFRKEAASKRADETLRLLASIIGCGYDDLRQRQRARSEEHTSELQSRI